MNRKALYKLSYGMYIVSSRNGDKFNGQIANSVFQVTAEPPRLAVCINKKNLTYEYISRSNIFVISILSVNTPMKQIGLFGFKSGRDTNKFSDIDYNIGKTGAPIILENSIAYIECNTKDSIDVGTHTVFIGEIVYADIICDEEPMTYAYYHHIKGGKSPETAPTFLGYKKEERGGKI